MLGDATRIPMLTMQAPNWHQKLTTTLLPRFVLGEDVKMYPKPRTATRYGVNDGCELDRAPA